MSHLAINNWSSKQTENQKLSPTALIVTKLLDNKNSEMLKRLSTKLGISNEEIFKLASEL
jgi:uncharacterized protein YidB (DUF937 family)